MTQLSVNNGKLKNIGNKILRNIFRIYKFALLKNYFN